MDWMALNFPKIFGIIGIMTPIKYSHFKRRSCAGIAALVMAISLQLLHGQENNKPTAYDGKSLELGVIPGALKFDVSYFETYPGTDFTINFNNNGLMAHNWLLTLPGRVDDLVTAAMAMDAQEGQQSGYLPGGFPVLAHSKLLQARESQSIRFKTPTEIGSYPYVCTFPGHGLVMRGIMKVVPSGSELKSPTRTQVSSQVARRSLEMTDVTPTPLGTKEAPLVIRTFMPNPGFTLSDLPQYQAGFPANRYNPSIGKDVPGTVKTISGIPAAVGVNFGSDFSYCWDTENCRLLYTWTGGFLNMEVYWGGGAGGGRKSFDYVPRLMGEITYLGIQPIPISIGSDSPDLKPKYVGYRMVDSVPQFIYTSKGAHIMETILPGSEPGAFIQKFMVHGVQCPVTLTFSEATRSRVTSNHGTWHGLDLIIPPANVSGFEIHWKSPTQ